MKKFISLLTASLMLFAVPATVMALDKEMGLKENNAMIEAIATGDDYLAGGGVPFEYASEPGNSLVGDISIQWADGGVNHTHQYVAAQALVILRNDKGDRTANLLTKYSATILANADWPDSYENDLGLYLGHFYDPYSGKTIFGISSPTVMTRFLAHAQNAKKYYAKNKNLSMQELGRALHYLADINVPHHAALLTALDSNHTAFETWADSTRVNYKVASTTFYSGITQADAKQNYAGYCNEIVDLSAIHALGYVDEATSIYTADWAIAAEESMENSQEITAAFLYNFLRSVNAVK